MTLRTVRGLYSHRLYYGHNYGKEVKNVQPRLVEPAQARKIRPQPKKMWRISPEVTPAADRHRKQAPREQPRLVARTTAQRPVRTRDRKGSLMNNHGW